MMVLLTFVGMTVKMGGGLHGKKCFLRNREYSLKLKAGSLKPEA